MMPAGLDVVAFMRPVRSKKRAARKTRVRVRAPRAVRHGAHISLVDGVMEYDPIIAIDFVVFVRTFVRNDARVETDLQHLDGRKCPRESNSSAKYLSCNVSFRSATAGGQQADR